MPSLPNLLAGLPGLTFDLPSWGGLLLQPLAPLALTTFHDGDEDRRRFVGTLGAPANLDAATPAGADVGVLVEGTGNVLAQPPSLGAEIHWNRRSAAPGTSGLVVRGEFGLAQPVLPPHAGVLPVLCFELLQAPGAGQAQAVSLGVQAVQRPSGTTLTLLSSIVDAPGPVRMRVGVVTGEAAGEPATNVALGGATSPTAFLDDSGARSLFDADGHGVAALELVLSHPSGGTVSVPGQLRVELVLPTDATADPRVVITGAPGLQLEVGVILRDDTRRIRAGATVPSLPERLAVEASRTPAETTVAWSTGTAAAPRSVRLPELSVSLAVAPTVGPPLAVDATITDLPPGIDVTAEEGVVTLQSSDGAVGSQIGGVSARAAGTLALDGTATAFDATLDAADLPAQATIRTTRSAAGVLSLIDYVASTALPAVEVDAQLTPAPVLGMQHVRAALDLPRALTVDLRLASVDAPDGLAAFVRARARTDVPLPTTRRDAQIVRGITVPAAPSPQAVALGPFGFLEAACAKVQAIRRVELRAVGPRGGVRPLRGPRITLAGAGVEERVVATLQRRTGPRALQRLARAELRFARPERIDLLLTPGAAGEVGVRLPGPLRPVGDAPTLGAFAVRLEPAYDERDPASTVAGLVTAGVGGINGTIVAVPAHLEVAISAFGAETAQPTPITIRDPRSTATLSVPAGFSGHRIDAFLDGNLAVRNINATLYGLDWQREQRWQRIRAGRLDVQPTGRVDGRTPSTHRLTVHQFGVTPAPANGGDDATGIALTIPPSCPLNASAVITSAAFPRSAALPTTPSGPTAAFGAPVQIDLGRLTGFLGVRVGPSALEQLPDVARVVGADSEWRIVAATPLGPAFLANTGVVALSLIEHLGLSVACLLVGGMLVLPTLGTSWIAGFAAAVLTTEYFTARKPPELAPLPTAAD